ncbi:T9SS type A sorting domain-containing protein [Bacteroidota bacterium]
MTPKIRCIKWYILLLILTSRSYVIGQVWIIDDGEKIKRDSTSLRFEQGIDNPIWAPGKPVHLFALKNETVAFQVVIEAEDLELTSVTVDLDMLYGPEGAVLHNTSTDPSQFVGRHIECFVEHYFHIDRQSGGPWENTLWWDSGDSGPVDGVWTGWMPDALIPIEVAPDWCPYPLQIDKGQNGVIWIDITIPQDQPPGLYKGRILVKNGNTQLEELDIELEVHNATLPDWPLKTMFFYEYSELAKRIGDSSYDIVDGAELHLWQLFHRHRITPFYTVLDTNDLNRILNKLNGSAFTRTKGYQGPAEGRGDDVLSLGTYGGYGQPSTGNLARVEAIADILSEEGLLTTTDVFVYAIDEDCESTYGQEWIDLLESSDNTNINYVRVGWTCSNHPASQPVDIVMMGASRYDQDKVAIAKDLGKTTWIYNGWQPCSGAFATDLDAVSPRVNGWIQAYYKIKRWFYWETTFWYDWNNGGLGPYDPFIESETFHNSWAEYGNGDGVLVYPGKQVDQFTEHSIGLDGVIASIRLKNIRRGIQDAGYYQLAARNDYRKANAIMEELVDPVLSNATEGDAPAWGNSGNKFFALRDSLAQLIIHGTPTGFEGKEDPGAKYESFEIENIYPNPFNKSTTITYHIPKLSYVRITIYNIWGKKSNTLVNQKLQEGNYEVVWDAFNQPPGIYFCCMETSNSKSTKKIIIAH